MHQVDKYTAIKLEDRGQYGFSLMEGWVNKAGEFKLSFCKREMGKEKVEKVLPLNVKLGDKATAIKTIAAIYKELTGETIDEGTPF